MRVLNTNKEYCQGVLHTLYKKLTRSIKVFLMLFLFFGGNTLAAFAQNPCANVDGVAQLCLGAGNQTYSATSCQPSTYIFSVVNTFGSTATLVSSSGNTATVNPGSTTGTYTVHVAATQTSAPFLTAPGSRSTAVNAITLSLAQQPVLCFGNNNGSITATFSGANSYTIAIDGLPATAQSSPYTFTSLSEGPHSVKVTGDNTCSNTKTITVTQPTVLVATGSGTNVSCFSGNNGTATVTASGGTPDYTFLWSNGATTQSLTGLAAGTYKVIVKDANGCVKEASYTVTAPPAVTLSLSPTQVPCVNVNGGGITATFSGGTGAIMIRLDGGAYTTQTSPYTFSAVAAGVHTVYIKDANNCETNMSVTVGTEICVYDGCSPGFWKNHTELWDGMADNPILAANMGMHPFTINTNYFTFFGLVPGANGFPINMTMLGAISQGGGGCNAFSRHAVSALLSSGSGLSINYNSLPGGISNYSELYSAIKTALLSGKCSGPLFSALEAISNDDHGNCGRFIKTVNNSDRSFLEYVPAVSKIEEVMPTGLKVSTFPNPYNDYVTFQIESNISGKGVLEVFNVTGQKIATVFEGNINSGKGQNIRFAVPEQNRSSLIYRLRVGEKTTTGKILYVN